MKQEEATRNNDYFRDGTNNKNSEFYFVQLNKNTPGWRRLSMYRKAMQYGDLYDF